MTTAHKKESFRKSLATTGDFALGLFWQLVAIFILFFFTDILGIPPAIAGAMIAINLVWDAINDPLIGRWVDRTSTKHGRFRPFMIYGAIPLAASYVAIFWLPSGEGIWLYVVAGGTLIISRTLYSIIAIPMLTIFVRIGSTEAERVTLMGWRMFFFIGSTIVVSLFTQPLVQLFGGGQRGWATVALLYAVIALVILWRVTHMFRPFDQPFPERTHTKSIFSRSFLNTLLANRALIAIVCMALASTISSTYFSQFVIYYYKYSLADENGGGTALAILGGLAFLTVLPWSLFARKITSRKTMIIGSIITILGFALWLPAERFGEQALLVPLFIMGVGLAGTLVSYESMALGAIIYGHQKTGTRLESQIVALSFLSQKIGLGIAALLAGLSLQSIGFEANSDMSESVLTNLTYLMIFVPIAGLVATIIAAYYFPRREVE